MARKKQQSGYTVAVAFKDSAKYANGGYPTSYEVGADVSDLDADRLDALVKRGVVTFNETKEEQE